jgi:TRAP-type transport system periplasmic protein
MDAMKNRSRLAAVVLAAIAMLATIGCGRGAGGEDKAGGSGEPVVLRLANTNGQIDFTPAVEYFVERVEERSGGHLRVEVANDWANSAPDAEQQVVSAVSSGEIDLGWVGTRVFDTLGVESFEALSAPMLIDSYALEHAVIESGVTEEMMQGLDELGVVGLGVLPDGLRKPVGVGGPIAGPADWRGIAFGTLRSNAQAHAIRALGATPVQVQWKEREERLANGTLQGFETSIWIHQHNPALARLAPYVTSNVTLWPQMDVLLGNPRRLEDLTAKQRGWLEAAAADAAGRAEAVADKDVEALGKSCAAGARFAKASAADLAALEAAFAPVYANLQRDPDTKAFIERIGALKESAQAEPVLSIPAECTGQAPKQASGSTGTAPAYLNGTYRYVLTKKAARKAGERDLSEYPRTNTWILKDGQFEVSGGLGGFSGAYSVDGNRITFAVDDYTTTWTFTVDDEGNLDLDPTAGVDPGDAFESGAHTVWTKID